MASLALYCRVSSDEQRRNETVRTQSEFLDRYCALHELPIVDRFIDEGVSGTIPLEHRPEGARLLEDARARHFDTVLVYKLDRLGRDPRVILNAVHELETLGVRVISATEPFDTGTPSGRFLLTILSGVAGLERDTIMERSSEGINRLARAGAWLGGIVPYGYRVEGKRHEARLVVDETFLPDLEISAADVIRLVFRLTVEESWTTVAIATHLNALGVPTHHARRLSRSTLGVWRTSNIWNILTNSTYMGVHRYGKRSKGGRELIERDVPAIVTPETWERAQVVMRQHFIQAKRNTRRSYLLRGLIRCGLCGLTFIGHTRCNRDGTETSYYVCGGHHSPRIVHGSIERRCLSRAIRADDLEGEVWARIVSLLEKPVEALRALSAEKSRGIQRADQLLAESATVERAISAKAPEKDMILDLYRRGRISAADLDRQLDKIGSEERELRARLADLNQQIASALNAERELASTEALLRELRDRLPDDPTPEQKRAIIDRLVAGITVSLVVEDGRRVNRVAIDWRFGVN